MEIKKLIDAILIKLIGREVASGHPVCKVRQRANVSPSGLRGVTASVKKRLVGINMSGKRAVK
ncbi:MAG: hypothetical protein M3539_08275 [Acidobacteriota bacterium]|nr:hypothetical protein [Acidobacteriota bacterium]